MTLHEMTVGAAAKAIRKGALSPVDLVEALLERIDALDSRVEAWAFIDRRGARKRSAELERSAAKGAFEGALHGVPFAAKDMFYSAGLPTEAGSEIYKGFVPTFDATVVARLKAAGAILLGKSHTTEFARSDPAPTHNPWNLGHTPGGSSSGSAAAVAARMAPAGLGTQTGGSTLRPASYCGIAGLTPSFGRVSLHGVIPLSWTLDHVGFMARSVEDLALLLQAGAGADAIDPSTARVPVSRYTEAVAKRRPPKMAVVRDFFFENLDADVARVTEAALRKLVDAGASASDVGLPASFGVIHAAHFVSEQAEVADVHADLYAANRRKYRPRMREAIELGFLIPGDLYIRAHRVRRLFRREMAKALAPYDVLVTPTTRTSAPKSLASTGDQSFQVPWSAAGLPALTLPCGLSADGLPLGLQLIAAPFAEAALLAAGAWCEDVLGRLPEPMLAGTGQKRA